MAKLTGSLFQGGKGRQNQQQAKRESTAQRQGKQVVVKPAL